jgi:hypothetical protein
VNERIQMASSDDEAGGGVAPSRGARDESSSLHAGLPSGAFRALAVVALLAIVIGRGIAPALPGAKAGIATWIMIGERLSALLSQMLLVGGSLVLIRLLVVMLRDPRLPAAYRLLVVPAGAAVLALVVSSATHTLNAEVTLGLALCSAVLAAAAAPLALRAPATRAVGLVLALAATAALLHVLARLVALRASEHALASVFLLARSISTAAFVIDAASLIAAAVWLIARHWIRGLIVVAVLLVVAAIVSFGALHGSRYDAPLWQVLAGRALGEMVRHPTPLVLPVLRYLAEVSALLLAGAAALAPRRVPVIAAALSLTLLARSSTDVPLLALVMTVAALLAASVSRGLQSRVQPRT